MAFRRVNHLKSWVIGSVVSDTDSEYLFGYDPEFGLMWLERSGVEYSPMDKVWNEADRYIKASFGKVPQEMLTPAEVWENPGVEMREVEMMGRPKTVTKSVVGEYDMSLPTAGDSRIVGDLSEGQEFDDDEIAGQAAEYLQELEGSDGY